MSNAKKVMACFLSLCLILSLLPVFTPAQAAFSDMPPSGYWSAPAVSAAVDNGLLLGNNGKLNPQGTLTRAEMAAMINRAFGATEKADISAYTDVAPGEWYWADMAKAVKMGTFVGDAGKLRPNDPITREEAFSVLARALMISGGKTDALAAFGDRGKISAWAVDTFAAMVKAGYIYGSGGLLNPGGNITREEFAQVMYTSVQAYYSEKGTYSKSVAGNAVVRAAGVVLRNMTISGDLVIAEGVADGSTVLDNVGVAGRVVVRGGGSDAGVTVNGASTISEIVVNAQTGVAVTIGDDATVGSVYITSNNTSVNAKAATVIVAAGVTGTTVNGEAVSGGRTVTAGKENNGGTPGGGTPGGGTPGGAETIATTSIVLSAAAVNAMLGSYTQLSVTRTPANGNDAITWSTSDSGVATVGPSGKVGAVGVGTAVISAETAGGFVASATVYVSAPVSGTSFTIDVPGTVVPSGSTYDVITISEGIAANEVTLTGVIINQLITHGGGSHSINLDGVSINQIDVAQTPVEGTRIYLSNAASIGLVNVTGANASVIVESESGSGSSVGAIVSAGDLTIRNLAVSTVSAAADVTLVSASVDAITTTGAGTVALDEASALNSLTAGAATTVSAPAGAQVINQISANAALTVGAPVNNITAAGSADITVTGSVGSITGTAGTVAVQGSGGSAVNVGADASVINVSGGRSVLVSGTADTVNITAGGGASVSISGTVSAVNLTGTGSVGNVTLEAGTPEVTIAASVTGGTLLQTGSAVPDITNSGAVRVVDGWENLTLQYIAITSYPQKLVYKTTDGGLQAAGMVVTGYYSLPGYDGLISKTQGAYTLSPWDTAPGSHVVALTSGGKTATFPVTVKDKVVSAISIQNLPAKLTYEKNEPLDVAGGRILVTYSDSVLYPGETVLMSAIDPNDIDDYSSGTVGTQQITVTYGGKTAKFSVIVKDTALEQLTAAKTSAKVALVEYYAGKLAQSYSAQGLASLAALKNTGLNTIAASASTADVTTRLNSSKSAMDAVWTRDQEWTAAADAFKTAHSATLAKTVNSVAISDKADVSQALSAYNALESGARAKLTAQKALLDSLLAKIGTLEAAQTLAEAQSAAAANVNKAFAAYASGYTANQAAIAAARDAGLAAIQSAATVGDVISAQDSGIAAMAAFKSDAVILSDAKAAAVTQLASYLPAGRALADYTAAGKTQLSDARAAGNAGINAAANASAVSAALAAAKTAIDGIQTSAQLAAAALLAAKAAAVTELTGFGDVNLYRPAQQTAFNNAKSAGAANINAAASTSAVSEALAAAKTAILAIQTNAQMTAVELTARKTAAKTELDTYKNGVSYRAGDLAAVQSAKASGMASIDTAATIADVSAMLAAAKSVIDAVPTAAMRAVADLAAAKGLAEAAAYMFTQAQAQDQTALGAALTAYVSALPGMSATGASVSVTVTDFTPAVSGTLENQSGANGSFKLTVTLSKDGAVPVTTAERTGTITATHYTPAPSVTVSPASQSVDYGAEVTLTATVHDILNPTYQWYVNSVNDNSTGTAIDGATAVTYSPATNVSGTKYYYCVVGGTKSNVVSVTAGAQPVSATPQNVTVGGMEESYILPHAEAIVLTVAPTADTYAYQWQKSSDGTVWNNIADAAGSTYTLSGIAATMTGTRYRCVVTNTEAGKAPASANSAPVQLVVIPEKPVFGTDVVPHPPTSQGGTGGFTVSAGIEYKLGASGNWTAAGGTEITGLAPGTYYFRFAAAEGTLAGDVLEAALDGFDSNAVVYTFAELQAAIGNPNVESVTIAGNIIVTEDMTVEKAVTMSGDLALLVDSGATVTVGEGGSISVIGGEIALNGTLLDDGLLELRDGGTLIVNGLLEVKAKNNAMFYNGSHLVNNGEIDNTDSGLVVVTTRFRDLTPAASSYSGAGALSQPVFYELWTDYLGGFEYGVTATDGSGHPLFDSVCVTPVENWPGSTAGVHDTIGITAGSTLDGVTITQAITVFRYTYDELNDGAIYQAKLQIDPGVDLTFAGPVYLSGGLVIGGDVTFNAYAEIRPHGTLTNNGNLAINDYMKLMAGADIDAPSGTARAQLVSNGGITVNGAIESFGGNAGIAAGSTLTNNGKLWFRDGGTLTLDQGGMLTLNSNAIFYSGSRLVNSGAIVNNDSSASVVITADRYQDREPLDSTYDDNGGAGTMTNPVFRELWTDNYDDFVDGVMATDEASNRLFDSIFIGPVENWPGNISGVHDTIEITDGSELDGAVITQAITVGAYIFDELNDNQAVHPATLQIDSGVNLTLAGPVFLSGDLVNGGTLTLGNYTEIRSHGALINSGTLTNTNNINVGNGRLENTGTLVNSVPNASQINVDKGGSFVNDGSFTNNGAFHGVSDTNVSPVMAYSGAAPASGLGNFSLQLVISDGQELADAANNPYVTEIWVAPYINDLDFLALPTEEDKAAALTVDLETSVTLAGKALIIPVYGIYEGHYNADGQPVDGQGQPVTEENDSLYRTGTYPIVLNIKNGAALTTDSYVQISGAINVADGGSLALSDGSYMKIRSKPAPDAAAYIDGALSIAGDVTVAQNAAIDNGGTITVTGALTNNGTINNFNTIIGSELIVGNAPVDSATVSTAAALEGAIDAGRKVINLTSDVTLTSSITIPEGVTLNILDGRQQDDWEAFTDVLTVPDGMTLNVEGVLNVMGKLQVDGDLVLPDGDEMNQHGNVYVNNGGRVYIGGALTIGDYSYIGVFSGELHADGSRIINHGTIDEFNGWVDVPNDNLLQGNPINRFASEIDFARSITAVLGGYPLSAPVDPADHSSEQGWPTDEQPEEFRLAYALAAAYGAVAPGENGWDPYHRIGYAEARNMLGAFWKAINGQSSELPDTVVLHQQDDPESPPYNDDWLLNFNNGDGDRLITAFLQALGPVTDETTTSFTVTDGGQPPVQFKEFTQHITISYDGDSQNGARIEFRNCEFAGGLTIELAAGQVYTVDLTNSCSVAGPVEVGGAGTNLTNNGENRVDLSGVPDDTAVTAEVCVNVSSNAPGGSFTLNGAEISGQDSESQDGYWFSAGVQWREDNNKPTLFFGGMTDTVSSITNDGYTDYIMNDDNTYNATLILGGKSDDLYISGSCNSGGLTVISASPDQQVTGDVMLSGITDITGLNFAGGPDNKIYLGADYRSFWAWDEGLQTNREYQGRTVLTVGDHEVFTNGGNGGDVAVVLGATSIVHVTQPGQHIKLADAENHSSADLAPHVFDYGEDGYAVFVNTQDISPVSYVLKQWSQDDGDYHDIAFTATPDPNGLELIPDDPGAITDPFSVRLAVQLDGGAQIVYERLERRSVSRADFAVQVRDAFRGGYGLTDVADETAAAAVLAGFEDLSGLDGNGMTALAFLIQNGLMHGSGPNTLAPFDPTTRGDAVVLLSRLLDIIGFELPEVEQNGDFLDVPPASPYYAGVMALANAGLVDGFEDGSFGVSNPLMPDEAGVLLARVKEMIADDRQSFALQLYGAFHTEDGGALMSAFNLTDVADEAAADAVLADYNDMEALDASGRLALAFLVQNGLMGQTDPNMLSPSAQLNRGDAVMLLYALVNSAGLTLTEVNGAVTFDDVTGDLECYEAVMAFARADIVHGYDPTHFAPDNPILPWEADILISRVLNLISPA